MADLAYRELYDMNPVKARKHLIKTCQQTGSVPKTARRCHKVRDFALQMHRAE